MKSPVPSISCRSLQHKCFVHVVKNSQSLPCISVITKFKQYFSSLSLVPSVCVCVCVCVCKKRQSQRQNARQRERETVSERERGGEEREGL